MARPPRFEAGRLMEGETSSAPDAKVAETLCAERKETLTQEAEELLVWKLLETVATPNELRDISLIRWDKFPDTLTWSKNFVEKGAAQFGFYTSNLAVQGHAVTGYEDVDPVLKQWRKETKPKPISARYEQAVAKELSQDQLPGVEYLWWLLQHSDIARIYFKNTDRIFFFGSLVALPDGSWGIPYLQYQMDRLVVGLQAMNQGNWNPGDTIMTFNKK